jgi:dephospho-CoA kinase
MSAWPGKFVIGLTGNIATGKSVVRKMLEHLGAYGIDADALSHRAISSEAPGYSAVLDAFGKWILGPDGQIDRTRLGRLVFSDPAALATLEAIVHPLVRQAIDLLVRRASQKVVVIEAIKLLEGPLASACDRIWVVTTPEEVQLLRLTKKRAMSAEVARQRIAAQSGQKAKAAAANVVIDNSGSFEDAWRQVQAAWGRHVPAGLIEAERVAAAPKGVPFVERAGPRQADEIASFITEMSKGRRKLARSDIMSAFGEKAFLLLKVDGHLVGLAGWQVENLVARASDVYLESGLVLGEAVRVLLDEIERASFDLQCEALLLFLPPHLARHNSVWGVLGYEMRAPQDLEVSAWKEAALESMPVGMVMLFKQLRKDRVMRPV